MKTFLILFISLLSCQSTTSPKQFSEAALNDTFTTLDGNSITLKDIVQKYNGKKVFIDIWASWCRDCINGMPKVKKIQEQFPEVEYVFFSLDKDADKWKKGIERYEVKGNHYFMQNGKKCEFANFVNIDWIPRYMVLDEQGNIKLFKAIKADDPKIVEALKK